MSTQTEPTSVKTQQNNNLSSGSSSRGQTPNSVAQHSVENNISNVNNKSDVLKNVNKRDLTAR